MTSRVPPSDHFHSPTASTPLNRLQNSPSFSTCDASVKVRTRNGRTRTPHGVNQLVTHPPSDNPGMQWPCIILSLRPCWEWMLGIQSQDTRSVEHGSSIPTPFFNLFNYILIFLFHVALERLIPWWRRISHSNVGHNDAVSKFLFVFHSRLSIQNYAV